MKSPFDDFLKIVEKGRKGENLWIPLGLDSLKNQLGLGQKVYYLLGGEPGTGKTGLADQLFVLAPYQWYIDNNTDTRYKLRIVYRSMERDTTRKIAKWVCRKLWTDYRIIIDVKVILGFLEGSQEVDDDLMDILIDMRSHFERMLDLVNILDGAENPTGIYKHCKEISIREGNYLVSDGNVIKLHNKEYPKGKVIKDYTDRHFDVSREGFKRYYEVVTINGEERKMYKYDKKYIPDNPNALNVVIIDHFGLMKNERGFSDKATLDKGSEYIVELRDTFGWSAVVINQFNRNMGDTSRRTKLQLVPEKQDFKGSNRMYEDSDVAMGLFNPNEYAMSTFMRYPINKFKNNDGFNRFRSLHVLKNSYGIDNFATALHFMGESGVFKSLPNPARLTDEQLAWYANPENHPAIRDKVRKFT